MTHAARGRAGDGRQSVGIAMYHAVARDPLPVSDWCFLGADTFQAQIRTLADRCDVIPLSSVARRLAGGEIARPTVAITFDDGFQNNYDVAFPVLREAGVPATVFLTTGLLDTDDTLWFCRINHAVATTRAAVLEWNGGTFDLKTRSARADASNVMQQALKEFSPPRFAAEVDGLLRLLGADPRARIAAESPYRMLDRESIREMLSSGLVEFGAHTKSHPILSRIGDEDQRGEIVDSLDAVRALTGRPCTMFAYPNGRVQDYTAVSVGILAANGVDTAVTAVEGVNDRLTDALQLKRHGIGGDERWGDFERLLKDVSASS